jgi:ABC-type multidrug transport system fused ATPase/permease subunit
MMFNILKKSWELATIIITAILSILFFIFLVMFPEFTYLAPIFLLFGSLITASLNIYMNRIHEAQKEERAMKRVMTNVRNTILQNRKIASDYSKKALSPTQKFNQLNSGFWDIISANATILEINGEELGQIMDIKMVTDEINGLILTRNDIINPASDNVASAFSLSRTSTPLSTVAYTLRKKLDLLIQKSDNYLSLDL